MTDGDKIKFFLFPHMLAISSDFHTIIGSQLRFRGTGIKITKLYLQLGPGLAALLNMES